MAPMKRIELWTYLYSVSVGIGCIGGWWLLAGLLGNEGPLAGAIEYGKRCTAEGIDPDHALGGAYRSECERLGAEGLIVACRQHHDQKHANTPTRRYWLGQLLGHGLRIRSRRLLALVEKAIARDEARNSARAEHESTGTR